MHQCLGISILCFFPPFLNFKIRISWLISGLKKKRIRQHLLRAELDAERKQDISEQRNIITFAFSLFFTSFNDRFLYFFKQNTSPEVTVWPRRYKTFPSCHSFISLQKQNLLQKKQPERTFTLTNITVRSKLA